MKFIAKTYDPPRRGTRVRAQLQLVITSLESDVKFSETCHTLVVNPQGCGIRLSTPLKPGLAVRLDELPGGNSATAHVASSTPLGTDGKYWVIGLSLDEPGNVWCIHPAPADWGAEPAEKPVTVPPPAKKGEWPYSVFSHRGESHPGKK